MNSTDTDISSSECSTISSSDNICEKLDETYVNHITETIQLCVKCSNKVNMCNNDDDTEVIKEIIFCNTCNKRKNNHPEHYIFCTRSNTITTTLLPD